MDGVRTSRHARATYRTGISPIVIKLMAQLVSCLKGCEDRIIDTPPRFGIGRAQRERRVIGRDNRLLATLDGLADHAPLYMIGLPPVTAMVAPDV